MIQWYRILIDRLLDIQAKYIIILDPDNVLSNEMINQEIVALSYIIHDYTDSIQFRYALLTHYESQISNGMCKLIIHMSDINQNTSNISYDVLSNAQVVSFSLYDVFENLSLCVVKCLDATSYDKLFNSVQLHHPEKLGENPSKDFILKYVFEVDADLINNDLDLLRLLLRLHYNETLMPKLIGDRFVDQLRGKHLIMGLDLSNVLYDKHVFFDFLQSQWGIYLNSLKLQTLKESNDIVKDPNYQAAMQIPFEHQDVRIYIDNYFQEGKLKAITNPGIDLTSYSWIACGIKQSTIDDIYLQINSRLVDLQRHEPNDSFQYKAWLEFAKKYAEVTSNMHTCSNPVQIQQLKTIGEDANKKFYTWLSEHYASLGSLPAMNPVMVHHIPKKIAYDREKERNKKSALIVIDGLSYDQWITVRDTIGMSKKDYSLSESAAFAWIPTTTSISRQAIFSSMQPLFFEKTISHTNNEQSLWQKFWEDNGVSNRYVSYIRGLGDGNPIDVLNAQLDIRQCQILGLVVDKVDKIMHGMQLGSKGMHNQIAQWCKTGYIQSLIDYLLENDFTVWITSDHGNIECVGEGNPKEGVISESRGARVRIYPTESLRDITATKFTSAHLWEPIGLPNNLYPLVSSYKGAFYQTGETVVAHGGVSIEEVIVPFIKITRRKCDKKPLE
jgi:hypothetical protein